jgi:hypothetical protein
MTQLVKPNPTLLHLGGVRRYERPAPDQIGEAANLGHRRRESSLHMRRSPLEEGFTLGVDALDFTHSACRHKLIDRRREHAHCASPSKKIRRNFPDLFVAFWPNDNGCGGGAHDHHFFSGFRSRNIWRKDAIAAPS